MKLTIDEAWEMCEMAKIRLADDGKTLCATMSNWKKGRITDSEAEIIRSNRKICIVALRIGGSRIAEDISIRITKDQAKRLREHADDREMTQSEVIRRWIDLLSAVEIPLS